MKRWTLISIAAAGTVLAVAASIQLHVNNHLRPPDYTYAGLVTPRLTRRAPEKMLVVVTDDRRKAAAFLTKATQTLRLLQEISIAPASLRHRDGRYGVPAGDNVRKLEDELVSGGLELIVERWEYGEVAEILHVGSADTLAETRARLEDFVRRQGYEPAGYEEEYVDRRSTIVRLRLRR